MATLAIAVKNSKDSKISAEQAMMALAIIFPYYSNENVLPQLDEEVVDCVRGIAHKCLVDIFGEAELNLMFANKENLIDAFTNTFDKFHAAIHDVSNTGDLLDKEVEKKAIEVAVNVDRKLFN